MAECCGCRQSAQCHWIANNEVNADIADYRCTRCSLVCWHYCRCRVEKRATNDKSRKWGRAAPSFQHHTTTCGFLLSKLHGLCRSTSTSMQRQHTAASHRAEGSSIPKLCLNFQKSPEKLKKYQTTDSSTAFCFFFFFCQSEKMLLLLLLLLLLAACNMLLAACLLLLLLPSCVLLPPPATVTQW